MAEIDVAMAACFQPSLSPGSPDRHRIKAALERGRRCEMIS